MRKKKEKEKKNALILNLSHVVNTGDFSYGFQSF